MKRTLILAGVLAAGLAANAQVQRNVMSEAFSNASCGPCAAQNPGYNALLSTNTSKVIAVKYQWYFPGFDPMNAQNPTEPNARIGYYGQSGVPCGVLDGTLFAGPNYVGALANLDQTEIDTRWAVTSPFAITLNPTLNAGKDSVTVTVDVNTPAAFSGANLKLHVLLVEKQITFSSAPGSNGETVFHHVVRKMITGSAGYTIQNSWAMTETQSYTFTIPMPNYIYDTRELEVVAFIQNNTSKEVHQAESSDFVPLINEYATTTPAAISNPLTCSTTMTGLTTTLKNIGNTAITSATVNYQVDGGTVNTIPYSGSLAIQGTTTINIPTLTGLAAGAHTINTWVTDVNGVSGIGYMGLNTKSFSTSAGVGAATPLTEDFSASGFPYTEWLLDNVDPSFTWARVATHTGSMKFDCFTYASGKTSNFIVEPVDLSGLTNPTLTFDVAYCQYAAENDRLQVYVSTDCGATWSTALFNEAGTVLATGNPDLTTAFTPSNSQWHPKSVDLSAYSSSSVVFIKFKGTSAYGNNIYVDNINIAGANSGIENTNADGFNVYPNPTSDFVNVSFANAENVTVSFINSVGQTVKVFNNVNTNAQLSLEGLASGIYILNADINGQRITKQIIKN